MISRPWAEPAWVCPYHHLFLLSFMYMCPEPAQVLASSVRMYFKFWICWTRKGVQTSDQQPETGSPDALTTFVGWGPARRAVAWVLSKGCCSLPAIRWGRSVQNAKDVAAFLKVWLSHKWSISVLELWSRKMSEQRISIIPLGFEAWAWWLWEGGWPSPGDQLYRRRAVQGLPVMGSHLPHPAQLLEERMRWHLKRWVEAPGRSGTSGMVPLALWGSLCFPAL